MSKRLILGTAIVAAVLAAAYQGYRTGYRRAVRGTVRVRPRAIASVPQARGPHVTTWADGQPMQGGPPRCGYVYPAIERWSPDEIDAMLAADPDCEVAYVWAVLAYYRQRRWGRYWQTLARFRPEHHFYRAALRDVRAHRVPPPPTRA